jgi:hypothetical protein
MSIALAEFLLYFAFFLMRDTCTEIALTVTGKTMAENLADINPPFPDNDALRSR